MGNVERGDLEAEEILARAVALFGYSLEELFGDQRHKHLMRRRQATLYVLRALTDLSYPELGVLVQKDHSTVMNAVQKVSSEKANGGGMTYHLAERLLEVCNATPQFVEFY